MTKSTFLLNHDDFLRRVVLNWLGLVSLAAIIGVIPTLREAAEDVYFQVNEWMLVTAHHYAMWSLLGLLSSSCCALQLILNSMSMGCAGFNTVLGPIRPTLLSLTIMLQMGSWYVAWSRPWQWAPTAISSMLVLFLSFLPELLHKYSFLITKRQAPTRGRVDQGNSIASSDMVLSFKMTSVGCSACLISVSNVLNRIVDVKKFDASIEDSLLHVTCTKEATKKEILNRLEDSGFPVVPL